MYGDAAELLESYPPEVALSALLRLAFKNELSESSYPEIRSIDVDRKGKARIFLAFGARDGYDTRKTVRLLKQECGLSDHDIDDVRVMEDFSFATVPFDQAEKVVRTLNKLSHGRPIAEISKDSPSARTSGGRQSHRRRESDTPIRTQNRPETRKPGILSPRLLRAGGFRCARRSERTSEIRPQPKKKRPARKPGRNPQQPSKRAAKRTHRRKPLRRELPNSPKTGSKSGSASDNPPATKRPNRTPKRKTEIKHQTGSPAEAGRSSAGDLAIVKLKVAPSP